MRIAVLLVALTACGAAQSALGALSGGPKVTVTVNTNVAPAEATVTPKTVATDVAKTSSKPEAKAEVAKADEHVGRDITTGAAAGAVAGTVAGLVVDGSTKTIATSALVGAGVGTLVGYAASRL